MKCRQRSAVWVKASGGRGPRTCRERLRQYNRPNRSDQSWWMPEMLWTNLRWNRNDNKYCRKSYMHCRSNVTDSCKCFGNDSPQYETRCHFHSWYIICDLLYQATDKPLVHEEVVYIACLRIGYFVNPHTRKRAICMEQTKCILHCTTLHRAYLPCIVTTSLLLTHEHDSQRPYCSHRLPCVTRSHAEEAKPSRYKYPESSRRRNVSPAIPRISTVCIQVSIVTILDFLCLYVYFYAFVNHFIASA